MTFDYLNDRSGESGAKLPRTDLISPLSKGDAIKTLNQHRQLKGGDTARAFLTDLICFNDQMKPEQEREQDLIKEAKGHFDKDERMQKLFVSEVMAKEFPETHKRTIINDDEERATIRAFAQFPDNAHGRDLAKQEILSWVGKKPSLTLAQQAELDIMRWYPKLAGTTLGLAIQREIASIQGGRNPLNVDENAQVDAAIKMPDNPPADRKVFTADELAKWARIDTGSRNLTESAHEKAVHQFPGAPDTVQEIAERVFSRQRVSQSESSTLASWRKDKYPYSKQWPSPDQARHLAAWHDVDADQWFGEARRILQWQLNNPGQRLSPEDDIKQGAFRTCTSSTEPDNPRFWKLFVRDTLAGRGITIKDFEPLNADEKVELAAWNMFRNVRSAASERGRELYIMKHFGQDWNHEREVEYNLVIGLEKRSPGRRR